ncbi:hypothetical protein PAHAL_9G251600 [Panicum hallii]|uniref:Uncharacterized protein n=1 Tax=Panicum hallii TaxID=206008 RepID=A0A2T8I2I6_9POAL|nr:hypothetical protein PAHAL_9G251600 [Panicum hallii]
MRALERENAAFGGPGCKADAFGSSFLSPLSVPAWRGRETGERPSSFLPRNHKFLLRISPQSSRGFPTHFIALFGGIDSPARFFQAGGGCSIRAPGRPLCRERFDLDFPHQNSTFPCAINH